MSNTHRRYSYDCASSLDNDVEHEIQGRGHPQPPPEEKQKKNVKKGFPNITGVHEPKNIGRR